MSTEQSYDIVFRDLEARHRRYTEEIERLTEEQGAVAQTLIHLRQFCKSTQESLPFQNSRRGFESTALTAARTVGSYSGLSTRWAILYLLAENSSEALGRAEIAKALTEGGITSTARSFASNVSAVLSGMANERNEVEQVGSGGFQITAHGRDVWEGVKRTPQWSARS